MESSNIFYIDLKFQLGIKFPIIPIIELIRYGKPTSEKMEFTGLLR